MRRKRETPTEKLHSLLAELGYTVILWMPARGYWSHLQQDVMRWTCHAHKENEPVGADGRRHVWVIGCWQTVQDCVKYGIVLEETDCYGVLECCPKWPTKPQSQQNDGEGDDD